LGDAMSSKGLLLENLTWVQAEQALTPDTVVVLPLGAGAKEHGPHLPLCNDWLLAEHFKQRVLEAADVVIAPTLAYHYYPAFVEYPGSISLRLETARDLIEDICISLAAFGPRRFYVLNTGISTVQALAPAREALAGRGLLLRYTDLRAAGRARIAELIEQEGGTHADEIETSMMLYIAPERVDMSKAARDYHPGQGRLTRRVDGGGTFSPSGIYGDATLANRDKGRAAVAAIVDSILQDIEQLRVQALPRATLDST
jgi:creatinine amidohydrolase